MTMLDIDHIRATIRHLAQLLPENETVLIINKNNPTQVDGYINELAGYKNGSSYDDPVTNDMLLHLAHKWANSSNGLFLQKEQESAEKPVAWRLDRNTRKMFDIYPTGNIFKGHFLCKKERDIRNSLNRSSHFKQFWKFVEQEWGLPQTPEDWAAPDKRS